MLLKFNVKTEFSFTVDAPSKSSANDDAPILAILGRLFRRNFTLNTELQSQGAKYPVIVDYVELMDVATLQLAWSYDDNEMVSRVFRMNSLFLCDRSSGLTSTCHESSRGFELLRRRYLCRTSCRLSQQAHGYWWELVEIASLSPIRIVAGDSAYVSSVLYTAVGGITSDDLCVSWRSRCVYHINFWEGFHHVYRNERGTLNCMTTSSLPKAVHGDDLQIAWLRASQSDDVCSSRSTPPKKPEAARPLNKCNLQSSKDLIPCYALARHSVLAQCSFSILARDAKGNKRFASGSDEWKVALKGVTDWAVQGRIGEFVYDAEAPLSVGSVSW